METTRVAAQISTAESTMCRDTAASGTPLKYW